MVEFYTTWGCVLQCYTTALPVLANDKWHHSPQHFLILHFPVWKQSHKVNKQLRICLKNNTFPLSTKCFPPSCRENDELCCKKINLSRAKSGNSSQGEHAVLIRMSQWERFLKGELWLIPEKWNCFPAQYLECLAWRPSLPGMHSWQCQRVPCCRPLGIHYLAIDFLPA